MRIGLLDAASGRYYPLRASHVKVGAGEDCQVVLDTRGVAPIHAEVKVSTIGVELTDHAGPGQTFVNGYEAARWYLSHDDRLRFGPLELTFLISDESSGRSESCARCGVEISRHTTLRFNPSGPHGIQLCAQCEARRSDSRGPAERTTQLRRPEPSASASDGGFHDPYGLLRDLDRGGDDLGQSLEGIPDLQPIEVIAKGAQGVIHKMRYQGELVAVKRLRFDMHSNAKERFQREARALRALNHPSLVRLYDSIERKNSAYLIMEFVDGPSLEAELESHGQIDLGRAMSLALQVAEGIVYLASQGIIHRDIKPSNVLIDGKGHARLVDFGLVRFTSPTHMLTAPGQMVGSPSYMSPEQVRAQNLSPRSDVFSLGVTFFEAVTGERPFPGSTPIELFTAILEDPPPLDRLTEMPHGSALARVFGRLLTKDPEQRPSPEEARDLLREVVAEIEDTVD